MAHWAKIDKDGVVEQVIVTSNDEPDEGESWISQNLDGVWLKTSYNTRKNMHILGGTPFRKNFAQVGGTYVSEIDAFVPPKKENEENFVIDQNLGIWVPPIPAPEDADFILHYGPDYSFDDISETSNIYFWIAEKNNWGLFYNSNYPSKPEGEFFWNPIEKEWQSPDVDRPAENYRWDPINKTWVEVNNTVGS